MTKRIPIMTDKDEIETTETDTQFYETLINDVKAFWSNSLMSAMCYTGIVALATIIVTAL